ncbi:Crp/Fnr family transcriptional regulator [Sphingobium sp. BHU LFT2]|uniref:Crp/Fnr family transcriptional regulator n=1 Tax=Sphingobium sp. BHU LFT2 TaxID=2807634 RepID=UPI001BE5B5F4|nr:Crp/Fnr family transcriptional regulator [Sphingobium sp. BHU LFT2]MBT2246086.1 Crp/Fnr family transcriptional regulator [Sphingobium sp. BHU LFT2]
MVAGIQKQNANLFLRSLLPPDYASISRHFIRVTFAARSLIQPAQSKIEYVDFPERGILLMTADANMKAACLTALVGREGFVGWPALMEHGTSPYDIRAGGQGVTLLRLSMATISSSMQERGTLRSSVLRSIHLVMLQMHATILSSKADPVERRLARLILMHHDRANGDDLFITHQDMAEMLMVRRASVTDALHIMEGQRLISSNRSHIIMRDRPGLCQIAGQTYGQP